MTLYGVEPATDSWTPNSVPKVQFATEEKATTEAAEVYKRCKPETKKKEEGSCGPVFPYGLTKIKKSD